MNSTLKPDQNEAFARALEAHIDTLVSQQEKRLFLAINGSPEAALALAMDVNDSHKATSKSRRYAHRFTEFIRSIQRYFHIIDIVISSHPEIAALIWGGIKLVLEVLTKYSRFFDSIDSIFDIIVEDLPYYDDYATKIYQSWPKVQEALANVYRDILKICTLVFRTFKHKDGSDRSRAKTFVKAFFTRSAEFDAITSDLRSHRAIIQRQIEHVDRQIFFKDHNLGSVERMAQGEERTKQTEELSVQRQERNAQRQERTAQAAERDAQQDERSAAQRARDEECNDKFLSLLNPVDCSSRHRQITHDTSIGTAEWIFESHEYEAWVLGNDPRGNVLWCRGTAGSGKSFIAASAIRNLEEDANGTSGRALAYFYFNFRDIATTDPHNALRSLLYQLLRLDPARHILTEISGSYTHYASADAFDLENLLRDAISAFSQVYLVVDALDECSDISAFLLVVCNLPRDARLLLTSRDELVIRRFLNPYTVLEISGPRVERDIRMYVAQEVQTCITRGDLITKNQGLITLICETLKEGANGMFLWVSLQLSYICKQVTDADIKLALAELPGGIEATYFRCMQRIEALGSRRAARCQRVLKRLLITIRSYSPAELAEEIGSAEMDVGVWQPERIVNDPQILVNDCAGLCSVQQLVSGSSVVTLIHASVRDYLLNDAPLDHKATSRHHIRPHFVLWRAWLEVAEENIRHQQSKGNWFMSSPFGYYRTEIYPRDNPAELHEWTQRLIGIAIQLWTISPKEHPWISICHCEEGVQQLTQAMLDKGLPIGQFPLEDNHVTSALHLAVKHNNTNLCKALLDCGVSVDLVDDRGYTPLHVACSNHRLAILREIAFKDTIMEFFLAHGADAFAKALTAETTFEVISANNSTLQQLLQSGVNVDVIDYEGNTPLHYTRDLRTLRCLLAHNVNASVHNARGETPLHFIFRYPRGFYWRGVRSHSVDATKTAIEELLAHGAEIQDKTLAGSSVLHVLSDIAHCSYAQNQRFKKGMTFQEQVPSTVGYTPSGYRKTDRIIFAHLLLTNGADPISIDNWGRTPLHILAENMNVAKGISKEACPLFVFLAWVAPQVLYTRDFLGRTPTDLLPLHWSVRLENALWRIIARRKHTVVPSDSASRQFERFCWLNAKPLVGRVLKNRQNEVSQDAPSSSSSFSIPSLPSLSDSDFSDSSSDLASNCGQLDYYVPWVSERQEGIRRRRTISLPAGYHQRT